MPLRRTRGSPSSIWLSSPVDPSSLLSAERSERHSTDASMDRLDFCLYAHPRHRRSRLYRQCDDRRARQTAATKSRSSTTSRAAIATPFPPGRRSSKATLSITRSWLGTLRDRRIDAVIHMAGDALVGESMADPGKLLPDERGRGALAARSDAGRRCEADRVFVNLCGLRRAGEDAARRGDADAADQPVWRVEARVRAGARLVSCRRTV